MWMSLIWEPIVWKRPWPVQNSRTAVPGSLSASAHRCSGSGQACARCVIPKTRGCYSAISEVIHLIQVNKGQFRELPGAVLFPVPQTETELSMPQPRPRPWPPLGPP